MVRLRERHWRGSRGRRVVLQASLRRGTNMAVMAKVRMLILFFNSVGANGLGLGLVVVLWIVVRLIILVLVLGSLGSWRRVLVLSTTAL